LTGLAASPENLIEVRLPQATRTDNGALSASTEVAVLSRLAMWGIKPGIVPERIEVLDSVTV